MIKSRDEKQPGNDYGGGYEKDIIENLHYLFQEAEQQKNYIATIDGIRVFVDKEKQILFFLKKAQSSIGIEYYQPRYTRSFFEYSKNRFKKIINEKNKNKQEKLIRSDDVFLSLKNNNSNYRENQLTMPVDLEKYKAMEGKIKTKIINERRSELWAQITRDDEAEAEDERNKINSRMGFTKGTPKNLADIVIMLELINNKKTIPIDTICQELSKNIIIDNNYLKQGYTYKIFGKYQSLEKYLPILIQEIEYLKYCAKTEGKRLVYNDLDNSVFLLKNNLYLTSQNFIFKIEFNDNSYQIYDMGEYSYNRNNKDLRNNKERTISKTLVINNGKIIYATDYVGRFIFELSGGIQAMEEDAGYSRVRWEASKEKENIKINIKKKHKNKVNKI